MRRKIITAPSAGAAMRIGAVCLALLLAVFLVPAATAATPPIDPAKVTAAVERWGERRLDQASFLTTHNAFANYGDARWAAPNQEESIQGQLDSGVRGLMLDTHWQEYQRGRCILSLGSDCYPSDVYLCHGKCANIGAVPGITYALPRQSFHGTMQTVVNFLNSHPQEVVTIFLEDYVDTDQFAQSLGKVSGLSELVFRPDAWGVRDHGWPKVADMVAANKRLLMIGNKSDREHLGVMWEERWAVVNYWSIGSGGNDLACTSAFGDRLPLNQQESGFRRLFLMNHFRDVATILTAGVDNGAKLRNRIVEQCRPAAGGREPNYVAVDFHRASDSSGHTPKSIVAELNMRQSVPPPVSPPPSSRGYSAELGDLTPR
ncbi:PI-PLC domain-containing protein [Streptomyces sp. NPDC001774]